LVEEMKKCLVGVKTSQALVVRVKIFGANVVEPDSVASIFLTSRNCNNEYSNPDL
jgi:hypothetical protein